MATNIHLHMETTYAERILNAFGHTFYAAEDRPATPEEVKQQLINFIISTTYIYEKGAIVAALPPPITIEVT